MFELEDYSTSGFHEGFLSKYPDSAATSTLDFYVSDSMQDLLDVDIRAEVAHVVGSSNEMSSSLDHALEAISAINNNSSAHTSYSSTTAASSMMMNSAMHASPTAKWMGSASSWSSDYFADLGACVDPISVMPFISSSLLHSSSLKTNLNAAASPPPASPCADRDPHKSHLTFSPAQMKISAGSMRREQVHAHIPKQIVSISSTVTGSTTAPATMATNSALQKRSTAVDAIRKDLATELRKAQQQTDDKVSKHRGGIGSLLSSSNIGATNTIKLAPGIGGLTFANSATYNKLKQQSNSAKSPNGAPVTANGTIVLKRDRDSSPLHHMATLNTAGTKRSHLNMVQPLNSYTPKSIASSAHSTHLQQQNGAVSGGSGTPIGSPASTSTSSISSLSHVNLTPLGSSSNLVNIANNGASTNGGSSTTGSTGVVVKPLQQKIKAAPIEPAFPKPAYSYSCLIAMALKNSRSGSLPVSEIYSFMCEHFPYFKNAPSGWKNSVRHNLSLNKCFEKIEKPATNGNQRKGCLWAMNPERITKMDEEIQKWSRKDPMAIRNAMVFPDNLDALERGEMKHGSADSDVELDSQSEIEETSDLEEQEFEETLVDNMFVEEDEEEDIDESQYHHQSHHHQLLENDAEQQQQEHEQHHNSNHHHIIDHDLLTQTQRDFDIEVDDTMYDEIEVDEDDKEAVRLAISRASDIIEINPADINASVLQQQPHYISRSRSSSSSNSAEGYQSPKRARLNLNYAIAPADEFVEHPYQQQSMKKVIVQQLQQVAQHQQQQQIVVQQQQFQQLNNHRRKMQLVSRIV